MKMHIQAHLYLTIAGALFGINYWISKFTMPPFRPEQVVFFRISAATVFFWLFITTRQFSLPPLRHILFIGIAGIFGVAFNQYFFFRGIQLCSAFETSILHLLSPILVALLAAAFLKEHLTFRKLLGIMLGFAGAAVISTSGKTLTISNTNFLGNIFIIFNVISYSIFLVMTRKMMLLYNPLVVITLAFTGGAIIYIPFVAFQHDLFNFEPIHYIDLAALTYVVVGSTIITYLLTLTALKFVEASTTGYYIFLQPFIAGFIGYAAGLEHFQTRTIIAVILLVVGGWLVLAKSAHHDFLNRWGFRFTKSVHDEESPD